MIDLVVLGAGPAGLGAAYRAAQQGYSVVLLEKAAHVGGVSASIDVGGMRVDLGSHRLHRSVEPRILADLQGLLGDELQLRERNGRIRLQGRWVAFPLKPKDMMRHMPLGFVAGVAKDTVVAPFRRAAEDTFADVVRAGLGPTVAERFYLPYARKIWGVEPTRLAGEQARRRISADGPLKLLMRLIAGGRGKGGALGAGSFWYPAGGYGRLTEVLADAALAEGAEIRLSASAEKIGVSPEMVTVFTGADSGVQARRVFSTIPMTALARAISPGAPPSVVEAARGLDFRSMTLVYLVLAADRYTAFDAHYLPESFTPVTRISEPKNYRSGADPDGVTVLCAEIPCRRGDEIWGAGPDELRAIVVEALADCDLPPPRVTDVHVERLPFAYPIYEVGFDQRFRAIDEWLSSHERLLTFGRQGLFAHDNAHHALAMAYAAIDCLTADGGFDHAAWNAARERFKSHVVED